MDRVRDLKCQEHGRALPLLTKVALEFPQNLCKHEKPNTHAHTGASPTHRNEGQRMQRHWDKAQSALPLTIGTQGNSGLSRACRAAQVQMRAMSENEGAGELEQSDHKAVAESSRFMSHWC